MSFDNLHHTPADSPTAWGVNVSRGQWLLASIGLPWWQWPFVGYYATRIIYPYLIPDPQYRNYDGVGNWLTEAYGYGRWLSNRSISELVVAFLIVVGFALRNTYFSRFGRGARIGTIVGTVVVVISFFLYRTDSHAAISPLMAIQELNASMIERALNLFTFLNPNESNFCMWYRFNLEILLFCCLCTLEGTLIGWLLGHRWIRLLTGLLLMLAAIPLLCWTGFVMGIAFEAQDAVGWMIVGLVVLVSGAGLICCSRQPRSCANAASSPSDTEETQLINAIE